MIYFLTIFWAAVIFIGSSIPSSELPEGPVYISALVHFFEYAVLGLFLSLSAKRLKIKDLRFKSILIILLSVGFLYALSDEWHQTFMPGREFEALDLVWDAIGLGLGGFLGGLKGFKRFWLHKVK